MKNACSRNVRISTARQNATTSSSGSSCHSGIVPPLVVVCVLVAPARPDAAVGARLVASPRPLRSGAAS